MQAAALLADQEADGARLPARGVHALAEVQQRVRRPPVAHLVVEPGQHDVVALAGLDHDLGHDEQADALHARRRAGDLGQHQVDDVLAQLVLARADPHLVAEQPVAAVVLRLGPGGDVGQRRAGLRLGQAHGAEEAALDHRAHVGVDLLGGAVREQQVGVADGEERVAAAADVRRLEEREQRVGDDGGQLHPADALVHRAGDQPGPGEHVERLLHLGQQHDLAVDDVRLVRVVGLVVRREVLGRHLLGEVQDGVERVARVLGVAGPLAQQLDVEPLVEQEVEVAAGEELARHATSVGSAP